MSLTTAEWHRRYKQQAQWTATLRHYLFEKSQISDAQAVLEVGSGTGAVTSSIHAQTKASVVGVDLLPNLALFAKSEDDRSHYLAGSGLDLPFKTASFDLSFCHFLLLWVSDPLTVLGEMARVTRPGGFIIAVAEPDYGGRVDYPASLMRIGELQADALARQGADPIAGRKLAAWFSAVGLEGIEIGILGGQWKVPSRLSDWQTEWAVLESDLAPYVSQDKLDRLRETEARARQSGERILFVPTFYAVGKVANERELHFANRE